MENLALAICLITIVFFVKIARSLGLCKIGSACQNRAKYCLICKLLHQNLYIKPMGISF